MDLIYITKRKDSFDRVLSDEDELPSQFIYSLKKKILMAIYGSVLTKV